MSRALNMIICLLGIGLCVVMVVYAAWKGETAATVAAGAGLLFFQRELHRDADRGGE